MKDLNYEPYKCSRSNAKGGMGFNKPPQIIDYK